MEEVTTESKGPENLSKIPEPKVLEEKELTPEEKFVASISPYPFLRYESGILSVKHPECEKLLTLKMLKIKDLVQRGKVINSLSGGSTSVDEQTVALNASIATVQVGFENLSIDLLNVEDSDLIIGLYLAVVNYNKFFRKTPLNFIL
jgi:hypothetical protein